MWGNKEDTYRFQVWIEDPEASKAWIAAAEEIRHLRAQLAISAS